MPRALQPFLTFNVALDCDMHIENDRPEFVCRHMTGREFLQFAAFEQSFAGRSATDTVTDLYDFLWSLLRGWRHMGEFEFSREALPDVCNIEDAKELLALIAQGGELTDTDQGNSGRPSSSSAANSAGTAPGQGVPILEPESSRISSTAQPADNGTPNAPYAGGLVTSS